MAYLGSETTEQRAAGGSGARAEFPRTASAVRAGGLRSGNPASRNDFTEAQRSAALKAALSDAPTGPRVDWERVTVFGTGIAIGLTVGAGLALLLAPLSGAETRAALRRRGRRLGTRGHDAWDDLRDELRAAAHHGRRSLRRSVQRGAWAAEDALAERRRRRQRQRALEAMED